MTEFNETSWWGDCTNTFHEEEKQFVYAARMGLRAQWGVAHPPSFDLEGRSVIDIGGGPVSLLLKCTERGRAVVADPGIWPKWVENRYAHAGIEYWRTEGESDTLTGYTFDEAWIYNVLTHTSDPQKIIENARSLASTIRIFEWLEMEPRPGHPQTLRSEQLDEWLGAPGFVAWVDERGAVGLAYYGVFRGL